MLLALGSLLAASAFAASYEEVGTFAGILTAPIEPEVFPEEVQLGGVSAMAINTTGAGGVAPGTLYAVDDLPEDMRVVRYEPEPNGHLKFVESWVARPTGLATAPPPCGPLFSTSCPAEPSGGSEGGLAVDQATGNVYMFSPKFVPGKPTIGEYNPDGTKLITTFGVAGEGEPLSTSAENIHYSSVISPLAVDAAGNVYFADELTQENFYHRLMKFEPQTPGDYEHYVYAGQQHDIVTGTVGARQPFRPVLDAAGNIYVASESSVVEYSPGVSTEPVCTFTEPKSSIKSMTVDPDTGEPFYYSYKALEIVHLSACNGKKEFVLLGSFKATPERGVLTALTFDQDRQFSPGRAPGLLYAATPTAFPSAFGKGEPGQSALGYIFAPVEENPPVVKSEQVSGVGETVAELHAEIDPKGSETSYAFQYTTAAAFAEGGESFTGAAESPAGGAVLGSGQQVLTAAVTAHGLSPETEYRYRVIATSHCAGDPTTICEATGPTKGFRTFPAEAPGLPDYRAYELVSPIEKFGGQVYPANPEQASCGTSCKPERFDEHFPMQASPDGEAIVYEGTPFSPEQGAVIENEYLSQRTAAGWQTADLTPPPLESHFEGGGYQAFDSNLTEGVLGQTHPSLTSNAPSEYTDIYTQPTGIPATLTPVLTEAPPNRSPLAGNNSLKMVYAGASSDLSHVFFEANDALTGESPFAPAAVDGGESQRNLYEWTNGGLRLVNVAPGNATTAPGAGFGADFRPGNDKNNVLHAISGDGSRVFWSSASGQVYLREDGERTVEIPDHNGRFVTAAADGSEVLLSDGRVYGHLDSQLPTEEADLTVGKGGFEGILGQSEDLSWMYFVDTAALNEQANGHGAVAQAGKPNIYAWHEGASVFIATLVVNSGALEANDSEDWAPLSTAQRSAEASPDGQWIAFLSGAELTGYDNTGPCHHVAAMMDDFEIAPCSEAFLYNAASRELKCVSCDRSGALPLGQTTLPIIAPASAPLAQPRYLTDSGRLYFDSRDALTPDDVNHDVEDVYEFEPNGIGTCARAEGCVSLISAGAGEVDSDFLAADESGKNVFFTTRDHLVPADKDQLIDVYDARENGGLPGQFEPTPSGCLGEACQSTAAPPPIEASVGTLTFSGEGNPLISPPVVATPKPKPLTRSQLLARALKQCKKKPHKKRVTCEKSARKKYGAKSASKRKGVGR